jgi:DNA-binding transcriptional MerR regulator
MSANIPIGELSRRAGVKVTTIRFYEGAGLMPKPPRSDGDRRLYDAGHVRRLSFIRHARELGFEMDDVRTLLELSDRPDGPCEPADEIAGRHLKAVEEKIAKLTALKSELARMLDCCGHGAVAECRVIESLADHRLCEAEH